MSGARALELLAVFSLQAAALLALAAATAGLLARAPARARRRLWLIALAGVLALPALGVVLPRWDLPWPSRVPTQAEPAGWARLRMPVPAEPAPQVAPSPVAVRKAPPGPPLPRVTAPRALPALVVGWLGGCLVTLAWPLIGLWRLRRLASGASLLCETVWVRELDAARRAVGCRRPVRLLCARNETTPMTWGLRRPVILLPGAARRWSRERRRLVLLHECVHVRRHDSTARLLARLVCALQWFNPLAWMAARRLAMEQEMACDEEVLAHGHRPTRYAWHLIEIARATAPRRMAPLSASSMARRTQMEGRVMSILDRRRPRTALALPALALLAGLVPALAAVRPAEPVSTAGLSATLGELRALQGELEPFEARLEELEMELRPLEEELARAERRLRPLERELEEVDGASEPLLERLRELERGMEPHQARLRELERESEPLQRQLRAIEEEMAPQAAVLESLVLEFEPYERRLRELEAELQPLHRELERLAREAPGEPGGENWAALAERMRPLQDRMEELHAEMRPLHERLGQLSAALRPFHERLEEVHRQMRPLHERMERIHREMRPELERLEELHGEMEPFRKRSSEWHERMRPLQEEMAAAHERMGPHHRRLEEIHREMRPLHERLEASHRRLQGELAAVIEEILEAELGALAPDAAVRRSAAGRIAESVSVRVDDAGRMRLRASEAELREILREELGPFPAGGDEAERALERAARAIATLEAVP